MAQSPCHDHRNCPGRYRSQRRPAVQLTTLKRLSLGLLVPLGALLCIGNAAADFRVAGVASVCGVSGGGATILSCNSDVKDSAAGYVGVTANGSASKSGETEWWLNWPPLAQLSLDEACLAYRDVQRISCRSVRSPPRERHSHNAGALTPDAWPYPTVSRVPSRGRSCHQPGCGE